MKYALVNADTSFEEFKKDWDALNKARGNHILLDSRFVSALITHFGSRDTMLAVDKEDPARGLALLVKDNLVSWSTFQPSQSPLGLILFPGADEQHRALLSFVKALPGYSVSLSVLQQDPLNSSFSATSSGDDVEVIDYIETPRLQLSGTFEEYWGQRSKNLTHNLERQTRRLKEQGRTLELAAVTDPKQVADCMREYGRLESEGWKGKEGTAIAEDNAQGRFYREILEAFCASGEGLIFQLLLDGKVVASDLCLFRDGMLVVLKTAYDETVEKLSPALLMRREIMRWLYADGRTTNIEYYGRVRDWHKQWAAETRTMFHLTVFRNVHAARARKLVKAIR